MLSRPASAPSLPPCRGDGWGSPGAPVGAAGECWHCRRVQQSIMFVLGALPNFIGWLLAERTSAAPHDQPGREQPVWCDWSQILHDGVGGMPEGNGRS